MLFRFIARHYLFAHRKKSVINVISWISLIGLGVGAAALIVVLSVYNGIGHVTQSLFNVFDPEVLVRPAKGKTFHLNAIPFDALQQAQHVQSVSQMVEENAWVTHGRNSAIVTLRGVDSIYRGMTRLDTMLYEGAYLLGHPQPSAVHYLLLGSAIYDQLGITPTDNVPLAVNIPKRTGAGIGLSATEAFNTGYAYPSGNFYVQQDADAKYVVADIDFVRRLMDYAPDEVTALAVALDSPKASKATMKELRVLLGNGFRVENRLEQQPLYYKVYRSERLSIYLILSLIVLIATLNLVASLSLLIIDKRHDIGILQSMGMSKQEVRRVFFSEGIMICGIGAMAGMLLGFLVCLLQQQWGLVKMGSGFLVQSFPVEMHLVDFVATFLLVMGLSSLSVWLTVRKVRI